MKITTNIYDTDKAKCNYVLNATRTMITMNEKVVDWCSTVSAKWVSVRTSTIIE